MGTQIEMAPAKLEPGMSFELRHIGGHIRKEVRFCGINDSHKRGVISVPLCGEYEFWIDGNDKHKRGEMLRKDMRYWFVDVGTLERVVAYRKRVEDGKAKE